MNSYQFSQAYPDSVSRVPDRHLHSYFLRFYGNKQKLGTACEGLTSPFTLSISGFKRCFKGREAPRGDAGNILLHWLNEKALFVVLEKFSPSFHQEVMKQQKYPGD